METQPSHFILAPIEAIFHQAPTYEKAPPCPDAFIWNGVTFTVIELLAEWHDFTRRGRMARNMEPGHAETASRRGSWGVGRYFFRVCVTDKRIFDIYYDRAPKNAGDRKGHWFLFGERKKV